MLAVLIEPADNAYRALAAVLVNAEVCALVKTVKSAGVKPTMLAEVSAWNWVVVRPEAIA